MDMNRSPEDNTAVIKMVRGFNRFLEKSPTSTPREQLDFNFLGKSSLSNIDNNSSRKRTSIGMFDNSSHKRTSVGMHLESSSSKRTSIGMLDESHKRNSISYSTLSIDEKAELIASKSKAAKLEDQLGTIKCERRRSDIEDEKKRKLQANKFAKDQEEIDVLRRKYKQIVEQRQSAIDDFTELEKTHNQLKNDLNSKIEELRKEKLHLKNCLEEIQCGNDTEFSELKENYMRQNLEMVICEKKLEETEAQLDAERSCLVETKKLVSDYNEMQSRCLLAEGKVQQLEQKFAQQDETSLVMQKSHAQLAKYRELERENKSLREDNRLYRDSASNSLILEEKITTLTSKVATSEVLKEKVEQLQYENQELLNKIKAWEAPDLYGFRKPRSPNELTRMIGDLQTTQLHLTGKNSQLETRTAMTNTLLNSKQEECMELLMQSREVTAQNELLEDKNQKLQRRLTLVSTERDGLRHVLSSYENEEGTAGKIHMQQAEEKVVQYSQQIKVLEDDLAAARVESVSLRTKYLEMEQECSRVKSSQQNSPTNIKSLVEARTLKDELEDLKSKYAKMSEEKEILELKVEKREIQGDYDPLKTRLLSMVYNPFQQAHEAYLEKMKNISEENDKMRKKIIQLQKARQDDMDESMNVSKLIKSSKPMEEAISQVQEWKLKYKRLEEQYTKKAKDFIFAVKYLLGYCFKEVKEHTYRLQSIYSEDPDHFFVFQCSQNKDGNIFTGVVQTKSAKEWHELLDTYVQGRDSIPAFLSAVNLELFKQVTNNVTLYDTAIDNSTCDN